MAPQNMELIDPGPLSEKLQRYKTIRIAISDDVELTKTEIAIVDTLRFQRLKQIRQLGTSHLVYPTALHTRFDHSLGTLAMAQNIINTVESSLLRESATAAEHSFDDDTKILIRLYALLHDITHVPFGHTLEDQFRISKAHEDKDRIQSVIGPNTTIGKILESSLGRALYNRLLTIFNISSDFDDVVYDAQHEITELEAQKLKDLLVYDIVSNTLCADLLDYLRRDSTFCNLGVDMDYRFIRYCFIHSIKIDDITIKRFAIRLAKPDETETRRDILTSLISLLDHRYFIAERVYYHPAKLILDTMLSSAISRALLTGQLQYDKLLDWGDEQLLDHLYPIDSDMRNRHNSNAERAAISHNDVQSIMKDFRHRILYKCVYSRSKNSYDGPADVPSISSLTEYFHPSLDYCDQMSSISPEYQNYLGCGYYRDNVRNRIELEDLIAKELELDPGDVVVMFSSTSMGMKLAKVHVKWGSRVSPLYSIQEFESSLREMHDKFKVIQDSHKGLWSFKVFIKRDRASEEIMRMAPAVIETNLLEMTASEQN